LRDQWSPALTISKGMHYLRQDPLAVTSVTSSNY
jgi:hypothetical protein